MQRAAIRQDTPADQGASATPLVHDVLNSPGKPLDETARAVMEPAFGHDFSGVRLHIDARAGESALAVNANAYTVGRHIVFGAQQYQPHDASNRRLLAHVNGAVVDPGTEFTEPTNVIEATGTSATVIDKTLPEPCAQC